PIVPVECGYLGYYHYPCKVDAKAAVQVAYNTQLASSLAGKNFDKLQPHHKNSIVLKKTTAYSRGGAPEEVKGARIGEAFQNKTFLDPSGFGGDPAEVGFILEGVSFIQLPAPQTKGEIACRLFPVKKKKKKIIHMCLLRTPHHPSCLDLAQTPNRSKHCIDTMLYFSL
ncbi:hypothetical protein ACUHZQ_09850, partial [Streptococcus pyogenes]